MSQKTIQRWIETGPLKGVLARKIRDGGWFSPSDRWLVSLRQGGMNGSISVTDELMSEVRVALIKACWPAFVASRVNGLFRNYLLGVRRFLLEVCPQIFLWTLFIGWSIGGLLLGAGANQPEFIVMVVTASLWFLRLSLVGVVGAFGLYLFDADHVLNSTTNSPRWFHTKEFAGALECVHENEFKQLLVKRLMEDGTILRDGPVYILAMSRIQDPA